MEDLANDREDGCRRFLELPNGIPSDGTFSAVPGCWNPERFTAWMAEAPAVTDGDNIVRLHRYSL
ncbi:hypothetical protein B0F87_10543 [Methylobacter tundripaludum]|uniref:Uncharacterized protein n=1 Tax=Methylobacter tundripaludum TaxID=173365 RepID=A0A2S6HDM4_9GAMM|nr:transposase family protein [Methylobacter tundripaludum]PPK75577.1 hypothetical protein B0F87_10543 [Methylobacter tundripaludum]